MVLGVVEILVKYDFWASRQILLRCRTLTSEQFGQRFAIGKGSLHDTTLHIVGSMQRWADRLAERPLRPSPENPDYPLSPNGVLHLLDHVGPDLAQSIRRVLQDRAEDAVLDYQVAPDRHVRFSKASAIAHVLAHGTHHRSQCLNMLRQLGVNHPPMEIDPIDWYIAMHPDT
ncbi:MAG: DinB family protein [bacterium]|jgi:uncharacterized damage-inducible protein DinB|nr:DinB family protein [Phycisphaerales bacterium]MCE2652158.1 DinB family protein [Planctomycetaceae bacterium]